MYFCVVLCIVCFVSFSVLFVCICVLYDCHQVATHLQLNMYHIISHRILSYHISYITYHIISYIISCITYHITYIISYYIYHIIPYDIKFWALHLKSRYKELMSFGPLSCQIKVFFFAHRLEITVVTFTLQSYWFSKPFVWVVNMKYHVISQ